MTRPQDARRDLRKMWKSVKAVSQADGDIRLCPVWKGSPGVLTRMRAANLVEALIALPAIRKSKRK